MTKLTRDQYIEKWKSVKLLALDVDGVLTDDSIYFGPDGFELKRFNISDGFLIVLAMRSGLELAIVSGRYSSSTETRMKDLGVKHVMQGMKDKTKMLEPLLEKLKMDFSEVAFIGNDLLDIKLAGRVGLPIAVSDANEKLKEVVLHVTEHKGGNGAVREILEDYFEAKGLDPASFITG
ncbi:MAG: HAD hydrolase family protein [candidate division Zixibacteria bacterium]|nr:HAD hydrolase family protein [candidate division Zixibacteria bacterium]